MEDIKSRLGVSDALWERWQNGWMRIPIGRRILPSSMAIFTPHILIDERVQVTGLWIGRSPR